MSTIQYRELACQFLQGNPPQWTDSLDISGFTAYLESQGILMLMEKHHAFINEFWPDQLLKSILIADAAGLHIEQHRHQRVTQLLNRCHAQNLEVLLFKGAANAYLLYNKPHQRQHADIDIMINADDYSKITRLLADMGFEIDTIAPSEFGPFQTTARMESSDHPAIYVDIHWKINNRLLLADALDFNELKQRAVLISAYGDTAKCFCEADALVAACIHEAGALPQERNRLISLYDAYLLMKKHGEPAIKDALETAAKSGIATICLDYLTRAARYFEDEDQLRILGEIKQDYRHLGREQSARLLSSTDSWLRDQWLDFLAVNGINTKSRYILNKLSRKL